MRQINLIGKRVIDIIGALACIAILGWLIIIAYLVSCITLKSNGLFVQERIGKNIRPFKVYKLKTMRRVEGYTSSTTTSKDIRVTRFGSFLRKTKIDELPQIWNVLNGTMSLVGPRPTVIEDVERMSSQQRKRFLVKPGITGWAQVNGNTALSWPERIRFDLYYIEKFNLLFDLKIIFKTLHLVITNKAETHPSFDDEWREA